GGPRRQAGPFSPDDCPGSAPGVLNKIHASIGSGRAVRGMRGDRKFLDWRHLMAAGILLPLLILCGCTDVPKLPAAPPARPTTHYLIHPATTPDFNFNNTPDLDAQPRVAPDGRTPLISPPNRRGGGLTTERARREISKPYSQQLIKPAVTVAIHG